MLPAALPAGVTPQADTLRSRDFLLLWGVGGIGNAMRWLEVLAAALFTLDVTGSQMAVAAVSAARSLPLIFTAALAGVLADAFDRRAIIAGGTLLSAVAAGAIAVLAWKGMLAPWHLFAASVASGLVYGTEMSARRRMVGECVVPRLTARAIALDSLTGSASRFVGPLLGGVAYEGLGVSGTFAASALFNLLAVAMVVCVRHHQPRRALSVAAVVTDLTEAAGLVRRSAVLSTVLLVTMAQNLFGFAYSALVAPVGRDVFGASAALIGVLAAAEPVGASLGGAVLALFGVPPGRPVRLLLVASAWFLAALAAMTLVTGFWASCLLLLAGGLGLAVYSNEQTTIALTETPEAARSRVMGLITTAVGCWPLGMLLAGFLADRLGPLRALSALGIAGLVWVGVTAVIQERRRPAGG